MSGVMHYQRKPVPARSDTVIAARYVPGQPLGSLSEVAARYDDDAELAEVTLPSGPVLLVRYTNMEGDRLFRAWIVVEPGGYLACGGTLHETSEADLRQWYDPVPS